MRKELQGLRLLPFTLTLESSPGMLDREEGTRLWTRLSRRRGQAGARAGPFSVQLPSTALATVCPVSHQLLQKSQSHCKPLIHSKPFRISSKATVFLSSLGDYFSTGLCPFPGPITPGFVKVRFQKSLTLENSLIVFTAPRDRGRTALQRAGHSQGHQRTVSTTWLPKVTVGGLRMSYCVGRGGSCACHWPGFFRMRKRATKSTYC